MSLIARFTKAKAPEDRWYPLDQAYPSLFGINGYVAALKGKGGVYALWHLGVRPQWLRIGAGADMLNCLNEAATALAASNLRANGGIYAAWTFVEAARRPGIVQYLRVRLDPVLQNMAVPGDTLWAAAPAPIQFPLPPGTTA